MDRRNKIQNYGGIFIGCEYMLAFYASFKALRSGNLLWVAYPLRRLLLLDHISLLPEILLM